MMTRTGWLQPATQRVQLQAAAARAGQATATTPILAMQRKRAAEILITFTSPCWLMLTRARGRLTVTNGRAALHLPTTVPVLGLTQQQGTRSVQRPLALKAMAIATATILAAAGGDLVTAIVASARGTCSAPVVADVPRVEDGANPSLDGGNHEPRPTGRRVYTSAQLLIQRQSRQASRRRSRKNKKNGPST